MSATQRCNYFTLTEIPCGLSALQWRTVRRTILPTHQLQVPLWTKLQSIRRTVRSPLADRPRYTCASPPETITPLEQFLNSTADCPAPLGGPSAVHVFNPPETTTSLDKILDSTADCPRPSGGPSAVQSCESHQRHRLWTNFKLQRRTVRSPIADCPQSNFAKLLETTSSLDKT